MEQFVCVCFRVPQPSREFPKRGEEWRGVGACRRSPPDTQLAPWDPAQWWVMAS